MIGDFSLRNNTDNLKSIISQPTSILKISFFLSSQTNDFQISVG